MGLRPKALLRKAGKNGLGIINKGKDTKAEMAALPYIVIITQDFLKVKRFLKINCLFLVTPTLMHFARIRNLFFRIF